MPQCDHPDGCAFSGTLRQLKRHWQKEHSGETWTDDEHLPEDTSEQRDFEGDEPETDAHNPEPLAKNDVPETERSSLSQFGGEDSDE